MTIKRKRIISFLLSVLMVLSLLPVQTWAEEPVQGMKLTLHRNLSETDEELICNGIITEYYVLPQLYDPNNEGKIHIGWGNNTTIDNSSKVFYPGDTVEGFVTLELYALWTTESDQYTIQFDPGDGSGEAYSVTKDKGEAYTIPGPEGLGFSKDDHTFAGWAYKRGRAADLLPGDKIIVNKPLTLYPIWMLNSSYHPISNTVPVSRNYVSMGNKSWRVIGKSRDRLLLISSGIMVDNVPWDAARYYYSSGISDIEKSTVLDRLFLSKGEAYSYFIDDEDRKPGGWWLRDISFLEDYAIVWAVESDGRIINEVVPLSGLDASGKYGIRPVFLLDLDKVLFTSADLGGKSSETAGNGKFGKLNEVSTSGKKLTIIDTLADSARKGFTASCSGVSGNMIDIDYSGALTGNKEYVSALICDASGSILKYASLTPGTDGSGTWTMTLPEELPNGDHTLKVFSEKQNGDFRTDYASPPTEFPLKISDGKVVLTEEQKPAASFTATGTDSGRLSLLEAGTKYTVSGAGLGDTGREITAGTDGIYNIASGISAGTLNIIKKSSGPLTLDSKPQSIEITKAEGPTGVGKTDCRSSSDNDGALTGVSSSMEYQRSGASGWTEIIGSTVPGLSPGTYLVRTKASGQALTSDSVSVTIEGYKAPPAPVTYSVTVNNGSGDGSYSEGESVTIKADTPAEGKTFKEWTGTEGLNFISGSAASDTATFKMPARDVTATATYEDAGNNNENNGEEKEPEKKPDRVPITEPDEVYASPEDNIAVIAPGSDNGTGGSIKDQVLDLSKVSESKVDPAGLKVTVINGSRFTTKTALKDKRSYKADKGIKVKVNKNTLIPSITAKKSGSVTLDMADGNSYTIAFKVEKPKAVKSEKKQKLGSGKITKTISDLFGTTIDGGELTAKGRAEVSGRTVIIDTSEKGTAEVSYRYLDKTYKMKIKVK